MSKKQNKIHESRKIRSLEYFGGAKRVTSRALFILSAFIFLVALGAFDNVHKFKQDVQDLKIEYERHQQIISDAETNPLYFTTTGNIINAVESELEGKWRLIYCFMNTNGQIKEASTYSIYTYEEIKNINRYDTIEIVIARNNNSIITETIDTKLKNFKFEEIGEYWELKYEIEANKSTAISCIIVSIFCFISGFVVFFINKKQGKLKNTLEDKKEDIPEKKERYCSYCGTLLKEQSSCPSCGSKKFQDKQN